jgi:cytochrome c-type protein NapB
MLVVIVISMRSIGASQQGADLHNEQVLLKGTDIPSEAATFAREDFAYTYLEMPIDESKERSLDDYYENRAFHGAPPTIPHEVLDERNMGDKSCLKCHQNGGYVKKWDAYTPVAPHPEKINCRQCHVPQHTETVFQPTNWHKDKAPSVGNNNALEGSPPVIPHQLQLHENCLSCHAGPGAPKEIRVTHPERINCRQCHVFNNKEVTDIGDFSRPKTTDHEK